MIGIERRLRKSKEEGLGRGICSWVRRGYSVGRERVEFRTGVVFRVSTGFLDVASARPRPSLQVV